MCAIAGAYAEQVPLVVLVGGPRTTQRRSASIKGIGCVCVTWGVGGFSAMMLRGTK